MIDIYANGIDLFAINMTIDQMDAIMQDNIVRGDYYIPFKFASGERGAIKKCEIRAYTEHLEGDG